MSFYGNNSSRSSHSHHPASYDHSGAGYSRTLIDEDMDEQMQYASARRERRSSHVASRTDASRSRYESSRRHNGSSHHSMSHASSRRSVDTGRSQYEANRYERADASTLHPDDSSSNVNRRFGRSHQSDTRDRPYSRFEQVISGYPSTQSSNAGSHSTSSRHRARSITHSHAYDAGPTYTYIPQTRSEMA